MKREMSKIIFLVLAVLTLTITLYGCTGDKESAKNTEEESTSEQSSSENDSSSKEPVVGGTIAVGIPQDLENSLDPHLAVAAGTREILFNLFEGLIKPDSEGNLVPAVASDYNISDDGKTYTFVLREGIKFHNGKPVTVSDIKYSIDRCADTTSGEPLVSAYSIIESVNIVDDSTVEIVLSESNTEFLGYMTTAIIPEDYEEQATKPIGTGPFIFVSRSPQENIILEKNEDYWGTPAYLDRVELKVIANADTIVTNLKGGTIDIFARLNSSQAAELSEDFNIEEGTMNLVQALYLNHNMEPFDNLLVRQAMSYAINPQEIMDMIADGKGTEIGSSMFPAFEKYYLKELNEIYTYDPVKAKELLTEAGYPDGFEMTITVPSNYQPHIDTAQVIVEELKAVGIKATINLVEWNSWLSDVYMNRNYETTVIGVDAAELTARALLERFVSSADGNFINYNNPEYDQLFNQVLTTVEEEKQIELYKEMETILAEDAANVYIQDLANLVAINKKLEGYTFYPVYVQDYSTIYYVE